MIHSIFCSCYIEQQIFFFIPDIPQNKIKEKLFPQALATSAKNRNYCMISDCILIGIPTKLFWNTFTLKLSKLSVDNYCPFNTNSCLFLLFVWTDKNRGNSGKCTPSSGASKSQSQTEAAIKLSATAPPVGEMTICRWYTDSDYLNRI